MKEQPQPQPHYIPTQIYGVQLGRRHEPGHALVEA